MSVEVAIPERTVCPQCHALFRGRFARCPRDGSALQPAVLDPLVGHTFADRYIIEDLLGEGGMGRVYRARHLRMSRRFAIKVLFGDQSANTKMVARFTREAEAASRLQHPNLVGVVDFGETEAGLLYLAMDYAAGPDLGLLIQRKGPLSGDRVLAITMQLCEGLDHAHSRGLIHRDFKPDNIIVETSERGGDVVRICDFGIAVLLEDETTSEGERLTTDGLVVGTPHYMAPEQSVGDPVDQRTDLFALGVILYEMIAGILPFEGTPAEVARFHLNVAPPPVARRVPGLAVDPLIEALAMRCMAKRPDDRPQTAREVADLVHLIRADRAEAARRLAVPIGPGAILHTEPMHHVTAASQLAVHRAETIGERPQSRRRSELDEPSDTVATERQRRGWVIPFAGVVLGGVVAGVILSRNDQSPRLEPVAIAVDAGAAVAVVPPPAPTIAELPVEAAPEAGPDAGAPDATAVAIVEPPPRRASSPPSRPPARLDPAPRRDPSPPEPRPKPEPTIAPKPEPAIEPTPEPAEPAVATLTGSLTQRYRTVGKRLDALVKARGENAAAPLKRRYLAIPYADAIRNPALASQVEAQLAALHQDVERALR